MRKLICLLFATSLLGAAWAQAPSTTKELTSMLRQFLRDASTNNAVGFDRFFADELIYTGSNGAVHTKAQIMQDLKTPSVGPSQTYTAQDVTVHAFGDTAIVAFQLVARTEHAGAPATVANYRDTGTFLRRNGRWQVIAWQATKMPAAAQPAGR